MTDAPEFTVLFRWSEDAAAEGAVHVLDAASLPQAKMQAAMLYAGAAFKRTPPDGYLILQQGREVHRYPVAAGRTASAAA